MFFNAVHVICCGTSELFKWEKTTLNSKEKQYLYSITEYILKYNKYVNCKCAFNPRAMCKYRGSSSYKEIREFETFRHALSCCLKLNEIYLTETNKKFTAQIKCGAIIEY